MDSHIPDDLLSLSLFCLGSPEYQRQNSDRATDALSRLEPNSTVAIVDKLNLVGLLHHNLSNIGYTSGLWAEAIAPYLELQQAYQKAILKKCQILGRQFEGAGLRPIILKGPSYWGRLYPEYMARRTGDIDLWLRSVDELWTACNMLTSFGYDCPIENTPEFINEPTTSSLYSYISYQEFDVSAECEPLVASSLDEGYREEGIARTTAGVFLVPIDVQLHKNPFMLPDGSAPPLNDCGLEAWSLDEAFDIMPLINELPYVSAKFCFDLHFEVIKGIKLLGDVVQAVLRLDEAAIAQAIEIATKWHVASYLLQSLSLAVHVMPEIQFEGIEASSPQSLLPLITKAIDTNPVKTI